MNGFEVIEADFSAVVVSFAMDLASRKWTTLEVTNMVKKRTTKKIDFVVTIRTIN